MSFPDVKWKNACSNDRKDNSFWMINTKDEATKFNKENNVRKDKNVKKSAHEFMGLVMVQNGKPKIHLN